MRCLIRTIAAQKDTLEYRDAEYVVNEISLGAASDCTLYLEGRGVLPRHALIALRRDGRVQIRADGGATLQINNKEQRSALLALNDTIRIGQHLLTVIQAPFGFDLALSLKTEGVVQEEGRLEFELGPMSLTEAGWSRRRWAWLGVLLVLIGGLILPLTWSLWPGDAKARPAHWPVTDNAWLSGPLHSVHRIPGLIDDCGACHEAPFVQVRDQACKTCHETPDHVAHPEKAPAFADQTCAGCHREHNEPATLVRHDEALCVDCHGDIAQHWPEKAELRDVGNFAAHPPFKLSLLHMQGSEWHTMRIAQDDPSLSEVSNLKFSHAQHLNPDGIDGPDGSTVMECVDCHQPQQNGKLMQPIQMEQHCASCHSLAFEATDPERQVPHGKPEAVVRALEEYYARLYAIQGGPVESVHELSRPAQRPGKPPKSFYAAMKAWADERALEAATTLMEESACHSCHDVTVHAEKSGAERWQVLPVRITEQWLPKSRFDHAAHLQIDCGECHAAVKSEKTTDVLLPDLANCQQCHGGEDSSSQVSSGCVGCHGYHPAAASGYHALFPRSTVQKLPSHNSALQRAVSQQKGSP